MSGLKIAPTLDLPMEAVTETFVILAKRGSGKTYTAAVLAEEIITAGHPCIVIDPIGVWWGLRSSADAKSPGLPVVIFGGDHGDVPLDEKSGELIADAIVGERFSAVLDLSLLSKSKSKTFMAAFIARLYHRNRDPLHIIVDEADAFAPQRTDAGGAVLLGAMEDLVRRGRARGIGCTLITQRPAVLNKDVLTQAEVLICLRMNGVRDVAAIDEWVRLHADEDEARELKKSLPSLPVGTAWVWSPGWLALLERVQIRKRTTFDSSATPGVGQKRIVPKQMADIDIEALGQKIAATAEEAKANDPKALKAEVARLHRELATAKAETPEPELVEVSVLTDEDRIVLESFGTAMREAVSESARVVEILDRLAQTHRPARAEIHPRSQPARGVFGRPAPTVAPVTSRSPGPTTTSTLPKAARLVIAVLSQHGSCSRTKLALLAGYSSKGGGFNNALSMLRSSGLLEGSNDSLMLTEAGMTAAADVEPLPEGAELIEHWRSTLGGGAPRKVFDILLQVWPTELDREELAQLAEYAPTGGGFNNAISKLRTLGLLVGDRYAMSVSDEIGGAA